MKKVYAVFRDRTGTTKFYSNLKKYKVSCNIVSTPKELGGKCGVSVLFSFNDLIKAKHCKNSGQYSTFVNFYLLEVLNNFKRFVIV